MTNDTPISILPILKAIPLFSELNDEDHQEIIRHIKLEYFPVHHIFFHKGEPGGLVYIIKKGIVRIFDENKEEEKQNVAMLGDNDWFGEMAAISEKPRNSSAETLEKSEIFVLKKDDFIQLISMNPNMATRISSEFLKRLKINLRAQRNG